MRIVLPNFNLTFSKRAKFLHTFSCHFSHLFMQLSPLLHTTTFSPSNPTEICPSLLPFLPSIDITTERERKKRKTAG
jgi:hypothetical protein